MLSPEDRFSAPQPPPAAAQRLSADLAKEAPAAYRTKLVMVPFRSGEAVIRHPGIRPLLDEGWKIKSAAPRITTEGTKLLVVLGTFGPARGAEAELSAGMPVARGKADPKP